MRLRNVLAAAGLAGACVALSGCGFTPVYATTDEAGRHGLRGVYLAGVIASEDTTPIIERAFARRTWRGDEQSPEYDLVVSVRERAQQLAVQIDSSVTRFNYIMDGRYTLKSRRTGEEITGSSSAEVSFNVVSSQYSTLFAEKSAREKAARVLAENIELSIMQRLSAARAPEAVAAASARGE